MERLINKMNEINSKEWLRKQPKGIWLPISKIPELNFYSIFSIIESDPRYMISSNWKMFKIRYNHELSGE